MKKIITIGIIILIVLGFGYYLFKISPQDVGSGGQTSSSGYNSALSTQNIPALSSVPKFDPKTDHYQGSPTAKNVFIEYADYQCPACAAYNEILKGVTTKFPDTVFVYRYFPLIQIHPNATEAAMAAEAAGAQGKYWEMHDILFQKQSEWESLSDPLNNFVQYAQTVGVSNIDQFKADINSKKYLAPIQQGFNEAMGLNLPGTPSFYFNGHTLQNQDLNGLLQQAQAYINK